MDGVHKIYIGAMRDESGDAFNGSEILDKIVSNFSNNLIKFEEILSKNLWKF